MGFWGFNTLLTGISLGGFFYTLNGQTAVATIVAIIYTVIVQYSILFLFKNVIKIYFIILFLINLLKTQYFYIHCWHVYF